MTLLLTTTVIHTNVSSRKSTSCPFLGQKLKCLFIHKREMLVFFLHKEQYLKQ